MSETALTDAVALDLLAALRERGWLCATAESCTGGLVAAAITAVAGSSDCFDRGFVTYSNLAKQQLLGVAEAMLATHGAVSEPVAAAMADGALAHSAAHVAVGITGIAGPGGAVAGKPVGTVCFGYALRGLAVRTETRHFAGDRAAVREGATAWALAALLRMAREASVDAAVKNAF